MTTTSQLEALRNDPWYGSLVQELIALHGECGQPDPGVGPSTDAAAPFCRVYGTDVGDWSSNDAAEKAACAYNSHLDDLYRALDIRHVGSGIYYTTAADRFCRAPADDRWLEFQGRATELVSSWMAHDAWDRFCDDPYVIVLV